MLKDMMDMEEITLISKTTHTSEACMKKNNQKNILVGIDH
jgi:hypothetical protein